MIVNRETFRNYFIFSSAYSLIIWLIRSFKPAQVEEDDFEVSTHSTAPNLTKQDLNV